MEKKLEAMEMWCYRKMLKVSWTEFVSKEEMLAKVKEEQQILTSITQRQLKFFGRVVREDGLEKLVLEGKIDGSRSRERQRKKYLDDLVAAAGTLRKRELSITEQIEIQMHGRQRQLTWYSKKKCG